MLEWGPCLQAGPRSRVQFPLISQTEGHRRGARDRRAPQRPRCCCVFHMGLCPGDGGATCWGQEPRASGGRPLEHASALGHCWANTAFLPRPVPLCPWGWVQSPQSPKPSVHCTWSDLPASSKPAWASLWPARALPAPHFHLPGVLPSWLQLLSFPLPEDPSSPCPPGPACTNSRGRELRPPVFAGPEEGRDPSAAARGWDTPVEAVLPPRAGQRLN